MRRVFHDQVPASESDLRLAQLTSTATFLPRHINHPDTSARTMAPSCQLNVVIVGAGIGGLGAALAIKHAGHHVTVLEQAPDFVEVSPF